MRVCWVLQALAKHARLARDTCTRVFFLALPPNRAWSSSQPIPGALFAQRKDRSMSRNLEGDDGPGGTRVRRMSCSCLVVCAWSLMCLQEYHEGWISCNVSNWHIDAWWWGLACSFRPTTSNYHTPFSLFDGFIYDQIQIYHAKWRVEIISLVSAISDLLCFQQSLFLQRIQIGSLLVCFSI